MIDNIKGILKDMGFRYEYDIMAHHHIWSKSNKEKTIQIIDKSLGSYANDLNYIKNCYVFSVGKFIQEGRYEYKELIFGIYTKKYVIKDKFIELASVDKYIKSKQDIENTLQTLYKIAECDNDRFYKVFPGFNNELSTYAQ